MRTRVAAEVTTSPSCWRARHALVARVVTSRKARTEHVQTRPHLRTSRTGAVRLRVGDAGIPGRRSVALFMRMAGLLAIGSVAVVGGLLLSVPLGIAYGLIRARPVLGAAFKVAAIACALELGFASLSVPWWSFFTWWVLPTECLVSARSVPSRCVARLEVAHAARTSDKTPNRHRPVRAVYTLRHRARLAVRLPASGDLRSRFLNSCEVDDTRARASAVRTTRDSQRKRRAPPWTSCSYWSSDWSPARSAASSASARRSC